MKLAGQMINMAYDMKRDLTKIEFHFVGDIRSYLETFLQKKVNLELKLFHKKRGNNSNAYMWELLGELQDMLNIEKELLYKEYIRRIGEYVVIPMKEIAVSKFISVWQKNGLGWFCDTQKSNTDGYTNVIAYYGSSSYDVKQMNRLVNLIVEDCREYGIETRTEQDIKSLLNMR